jgi:hypothetical protein
MCQCCNFITEKKANYNRHLLTTKHISKNIVNECTYGLNNVEGVENKTPSIFEVSGKYPKVSSSIQYDTKKIVCETKKFVCANCNKSFTHKNNYYRHIKHRCDIQNDDTVNIKEYKDLMGKLLDLKDELIIEKDKRLEETKENVLLLNKNKNNNLINYIKGDVNNNTYNTLNNTNYVLNYINYSEADSMDNIKDKFKLTRDEFLKASQTNGYRGALMEKAKNIIIKPYLEMESKRPIHTVDSSRNKALYKDDMNNNWTFNPKTTLEQCFKTFHNSALDHQDTTIKENPNLVILSNEENLYKQTYFIPTEIKEKESIYREIKNHIYEKTKIKKGNLNIQDDREIDLIDLHKEMFDCGNKYIFDIDSNLVYDPNDKYKCIGVREYNNILNNYFIKYY